MSYRDTELRVVILGARGTGKTSLVKKYIHSHFPAAHDLTGDTPSKKQISIDSQTSVLLDLFEAQPSSESNLHRTGQAFILLYAINDKETLTHIRQQHKHLREARGPSLSSVPVYFVGSKADLEAERQVSLEEARQLAIELRCQKLFEISARNHTDEINDLFSKIARQHLTFQQASMTTRPPMTPVQSTPKPVSTTPASPSNDGSPRRSSVLERLKFGSLKRKASIQSLARKKSGSFSESIMSLASARPSRDNVRSVSYGQSNMQSETISNSNRSYYNNVTLPRKSLAGSPYRLDVNTSAWRDTIKWPTEIIPEEDLLAK